MTESKIPELKVGDRAPEWRALTDEGSSVESTDLAGRRYVLYFYPRDHTPGCTREACDFRDNFVRLSAFDVEVFGVSTDSTARHGNFKRKHSLPFTLLSDPDKELIAAFGADRGSSSARRMTYIVGPDGLIEAVWSAVKVAGHVDEILGKLKEFF